MVQIQSLEGYLTGMRCFKSMPKRNNQPRIPKRQTGSLKSIEKHIYIFCEGQKTEKYYFDHFKKHIEKNAVYKNSVFVETFGLGKNTISVLDEAKDYIEKQGAFDVLAWCVFDKDDFPEVNFNAAIQRAIDLSNDKNGPKYETAWSNECFEYWYILHFGYYDADTDRRSYNTYLDEKYRNYGLGGYNKTNPNHFTLLLEYGNPKNAIKFAEKRMRELGECTPSKAKPATTVFQLVKVLARYLPKDMRDKFI